MNVLPSADKDYRLWTLLHQARDAMFKTREKELRQYGITTQEAAVLFILETIGDKATPAKISQWLFREHHTVSALLSRMEKKGLIMKAKDSDRRTMWRIKLTEKGQNACRQSVKRESIHTAMSTLSENERQRLESYLRKIRDQALKHLSSESNLPFP